MFFSIQNGIDDECQENGMKPVSYIIIIPVQTPDWDDILAINYFLLRSLCPSDVRY